MNKHSPMRTNLKTAVAGLIVFGSLVLLYTEGIKGLERAGGGSLNARALTMIDYLPEITAQPADRKLVMFFGSSMVEAGFDPLAFDGVMAGEGLAVTSYNYGLGNLNPRFQELLTRRIREAFERDGRRLALALVEFNPFQTTIRRNQTTRMMDEQNIAILSSPGELWRETLEDPSVGTRMFVIRYLRKGYSAELLTTLPQLIAANTPSGFVESEEYRAAQERRNQANREFFARFAEDDYPEPALPGWDPATRGARLDLSLISAETRAALTPLQEASRHPLLMQQDLQRRIVSADILELRFDETLIAAFIEMVRNFQAIAETVEVVLLPRNTEYVIYTPEVRARLEAVKRRIAEETGVVIRDQQLHRLIDGSHFADSTHMNTGGTELYSRALAADYAEALRAAD